MQLCIQYEMIVKSYILYLDGKWIKNNLLSMVVIVRVSISTGVLFLSMHAYLIEHPLLNM